MTGRSMRSSASRRLTAPRISPGGRAADRADPDRDAADGPLQRAPAVAGEPDLDRDAAPALNSRCRCAISRVGAAGGRSTRTLQARSRRSRVDRDRRAGRDAPPAAVTAR